MLHGDLLRIEHAGGTSWRLLRSSHGHAPDDDDDDDEVANLLSAQVNSASYPQWDGK